MLSWRCTNNRNKIQYWCVIMKKSVFIALNIIIPLVIGSVLYYVMSPDTIFVKIIDWIINREIHRPTILLRNGIHRFLRFYLLDMCWAYALTFSLHTILGNNTADLKKDFLIAFVFSAVMELLQLTAFVNGTFDVLDILCEALAVGSAVFIIKYAHEEAMKMKKKFKVLAIVLCMVLFATMAIGSGSSESGGGKEVVSSGNSEGKDNSQTDKKEEESTITIEDQVLLDKDGIVVTAKEYVIDSIWGEGIKLLVENNGDRAVTVSSDAVIVNNFMISALFVEEVAPGKKSNETLYLSSSELKAAGIETVGQVELYFHVYDSESYEGIFDSDGVTIKTSAFASMDANPDDSGTELYNANGIRIVGKTVDENSFWGTAILLYCENTSGKNVGISVEEMSINGFMMNPLFSTTVYDGKVALDDITIFSTDLEENGITAIEEVELKFHIYDANSYDMIANSDAITFFAK